MRKHCFWKTVWSFLKKLKIEPRYDPAIPFLAIYSIYSKETKSLTQKDYLRSHIHCSIIYNSQDIEQPKYPPMDKEGVWCIHTHTHTHTQKGRKGVRWII